MVPVASRPSHPPLARAPRAGGRALLPLRATLRATPRAALLAALLGGLLAAGCAARGPAGPGAPAPRLEGTYELVARELPDGTRRQPPEVLGVMDISPTHRNLNVSWMQDGRRHGVGIITRWQVVDGVYTETRVYRMDDLPGQGLRYRTDPATGSAPVRRAPGVLRIQMPLDGEPALEVRADGITSHRPGAFTDHWRRLR